MTANGILQEIREALNGRPGQPIVLGVCRTLANRFHLEVWKVRLAAIVLGLVWSLPVLLAYVVAGIALTETERRTRDFFSGLAVVLREAAGRATAALGRLFEQDSGHRRQSRGY